LGREQPVAEDTCGSSFLDLKRVRACSFGGALELVLHPLY
jgi:hypothetical protein